MPIVIYRLTRLCAFPDLNLDIYIFLFIAVTSYLPIPFNGVHPRYGTGGDYDKCAHSGRFAKTPKSYHKYGSESLTSRRNTYPTAQHAYLFNLKFTQVTRSPSNSLTKQ